MTARRIGALLVGLSLLVLAGCSHPQRNPELSAIDYRSGYRWTQLPRKPLEETIVVVTASGGGTRAAALALGTLQGLEAARLPQTGGSLLDEVDLISSNSGGSVTAAHFALRGAAGFEALERDFLRRDGISALLWRGLNPLGLARLSTPAYARVDLLADYLDERLFHGATYATLLEQGSGSYLVVNAADMTQGTAFPFTQPTFDLLCSDLAGVRLADAVAASAAFPVALSPLTLTDYSPCAAQRAEGERWPPRWVANATGTSWHINPSRVRRGRSAEAYLNAGAAAGERGYVHLLDGGIADNLGVTEPFRLLTTVEVSPQFLTDIAQGRATRVVFVMVNARSDDGAGLSASAETPGALAMLQATLSSAIDNATFGSVDRLEVLLRERLRQLAQNMPPVLRERLEGLETYFVAVDFDAIDDTRCRAAFQGVATSWTLTDREVDALLLAGAGLLRRDPAYRALLDRLGARDGGGATLEQACGALLPGGS